MHLKRHFLNRKLLFVLLSISFVGSNSSLIGQSYVEVDGVVSIEVEKLFSKKGFSVARQYTGEFLKSDSTFSTFEVDIDFSSVGNYSVWILGRAEKPASNKAVISIGNEEAEVNFNNHFAPIWICATRPLPISKVGIHRFNLKVQDQKGLVIDKLAFIHRGAREPSGTGFLETVSGAISPIPIGFDSSVIIPPHWAFGVLYGGYTNQKDSEETVNRLINEGYPIDAYWIDSWFWDYATEGKGSAGYLDFKGDSLAFPNPELLWKTFEIQHVKAGVWVWNTILKEGNEAIFNEFESKKLFKKVYLNKDRWHNKSGQSLTGDIDFENPDAVRLWKSKLKPFFDKGLDFLKLDREADVPYLKANFEATSEMGKETNGRGFVLSHLMHTDNPEFKKYPTKWTGDAKIAWEQPDYPDFGRYAMGSYKENVEMMANPRKTTYEVPFLAHDAGGYDFFGTTDTLDNWDDLYTRWIQFASFTPIMTVFSTAKNPRKNLPYAFSKASQQSFNFYTKLRMRLFPYRYTYALRTRLYGEKMIKGSPENPHQYLFGDEFFIAPVLEKHATSALVSLPLGEWISFHTNEVFKGNQTIRVDAPLDVLPMFIRKGAIIPTRNDARSIEQGTNDSLTIDIYPNHTSTFTLLEDDGLSNDYLSGFIGETTITYNEDEKKLIIGKLNGDFKGKPQQRFYLVKIHFINQVEEVTIDEKGMNHYKLTGDILHIPFEAITSKPTELQWK